MNKQTGNKKLAVIIVAVFIVLAAIFIAALIIENNKTAKMTVVINQGLSQGYAPGAKCDGIEEADINAAIAAKLGMMLKESGYDVYLTHPADGYDGKTLMTNAKAADVNNVPDKINAVDPNLLISIHCNYTPNSDAANGYEFYWSSYKPKLDDRDIVSVPGQWDNEDGLQDATPCYEAEQSEKLANILKENFEKTLRPDLSPRPDCIYERKDFVLSETICPAVIIKTGFINNPNDAAFLNGKSGQLKIAGTIKDAIDQYLTYLEYGDDFTETTEIMGPQTVYKKEMVDIIKRNMPFDAAFYGMELSDFVQIVIDEATIEGVRPEVILAQMIVETNFLSFYDSVVDRESFNFGGLGATDKGGEPNTFPDVRTGIRAQVQHMKAYASMEPLAQKCVDQGFIYVERGIAKTIGKLGNGLWASDPDYAEKILYYLNRM